MLEWAIDGLGSLLGIGAGAVANAVGWTWEAVIQGFYTWLASGIALLLEWVWSILDSASTPRLTEDWYRNELAARVGVIGLAAVIAMMLCSAIQAALAGRPEQIGDALKEGVRAIVATALLISVVDVMLGVTDEAAGLVWQSGRQDLVDTIDNLAMVASSSPWLSTNVMGPACLMLGLVALIGLSVSLLMRSALIYVAAALAPIVFAANVLPLFRGSARKLVHLLVSLVLAKLAIVITLVCAVKLMANPAGGTGDAPAVNDGAAAVGTLLTGFICFLVAAVSPMVLYRLMPTVEGAAVSSGVAGGWTRGITSAAQVVVTAKSLGASKGGSMATKPLAGAPGASDAGASAKPGPITGFSSLSTAGGHTSHRTTSQSADHPTAPTTVRPKTSDRPSTPQRPQTDRSHETSSS